MMKLSSFSFGKILLVSASLATTGLCAVSVSSDPVGVLFYNFNSNADNNIGLGLARPSAFEGRIASVDLVNNSVTFEGNPGWSNDQFVATPESHYLYIKSGDEEGMHVTVTANTADSVTVFLDTGDRLDRLVVGEVASIVPYTTLDTLFVNGASEGTILYIARGRRPTVGNYDAVQVDYLNGEWRKTSDNSLANNMAIYPNECIQVRNYGPAFDMAVCGVVPMATVRIVLRSNGLTVMREQRFSFFSAADFTLGEVSLLNDGDTVRSFDPTAISRTADWLAYVWGDWYDMTKYSQFPTPDSTVQFYSGTAYGYEGYQNLTSETVLWIQHQPYLD